MSRVPNSETPEHEAKRFWRAFDRQVGRRDYVYAWTTVDDEIAEDAIIVAIGGSSAVMLMAGLSYVEPTASIYWCARVTQMGVFDIGEEPGPFPVPEALHRAHELRVQMGYERVVVTMEEAGIWRAEWGVLADREGY